MVDVESVVNCLLKKGDVLIPIFYDAAWNSDPP